MNQRRKIAAAGAGLLVAAAVAGVGSAAAAGGGSKINITEKLTFKAGQYLQDNLRYGPATITVHSGSTLTIVNKVPPNGNPEPHTFSVVTKSQQPLTQKRLAACNVLGPGSICRTLAIAHGVNPNQPPQGPPPNLVVNKGGTGIDAPGDSVFLAPGFKTQALQITAKPGTTLYYMCIVHPWMQGKIKVVK